MASSLQCSLLDALEALQLCAILPALRALGVERLADVGDLLTGDLEEAGLSRVQLRRLQMLASGGGAVPAFPVRNLMRMHEVAYFSLFDEDAARLEPYPSQPCAAWSRASALRCTWASAWASTCQSHRKRSSTCL